MRRIAAAVLLVTLPGIAFAGFRVSSFKKETKLGANHWNVASALDGDKDTCWMTDPESENMGEWIEIDLPRSEVDKIGVIVGWAKDDTRFADYARVKAMRIEVFTTDMDDNEKVVLEQTVEFTDTQDWQLVDLPDTKVGGELFGGKVRATVTAVYPGQDYPNLAMSEFLVHLKEMDAHTAMVSEPESAAAGHGSENMLDKNGRTFWASDGKGEGQEFAIEASGFGVSSIGIQPGPKSHARPKTLKLTVNDMEQTVTLADKQAVQWFPLPAVIGYTGSSWGDVKVQVVDTYPGSDPAVGIAEVQLKATNYEGL